MTAEEFRRIIEREALALLAKDKIPDKAKYDGVRRARKSLYMLVQGFKNKQSVEAVMRWTVVEVAEDRRWADEQPDPTRWPDGFCSHGDLVQEALFLAGMADDKRSRNIKSRLVKVGNLAMFAKEHGISIDEAMNNSWTQLRDGLPAVGGAIRMADDDVDDAVEALEEILDDVQELSHKEFKEKYVTPRHDKAGTATIKTTPQGVTVYLAILNSADDIERVSQVTGGLFDWGLNAKMYDNGNGVAINVEGAQQVSDVYRQPEKEVA